MRWMTFGGKALSDFETFWDGSQVFKKPPKRFDKYTIPGRNGSLVVSQKSFDDVIIPFKCFIRKDFEKNFTNLMDYLNSFNDYQKLETSIESEIYREAIFHSAVVPETGVFNKFGTFVLEFDCMPQEFLKVGDEPISISNGSTIKLNNPTLQPARPLIYIKSMSDDGVLTINGQQISVFQSSYQIYIDCDTMHAYRITGSSVVSFDAVVTMPDTFVELAMGENTITCTGMDIDLFPRWWRL